MQEETQNTENEAPEEEGGREMTQEATRDEVVVDGSDDLKDVHVTDSRALRVFLIVLGSINVGLGIIGAFLPVMPTTVFLLIAAACYARASPRFYLWLINNPTFGPTVRAWREDRSIPRKSRRMALSMIVLSFAISISVVPPLWVKGLLVVIGVSVFAYVWRIKIREE